MSLVVIVARDLLISTRIIDVATVAGHDVLRIDAPSDLPSPASVSVVFVDWSARERAWADELAAWCTGAPQSDRPRMILFGPHTDLVAHADARAARLGPMLARSKLLSELPGLIG